MITACAAWVLSGATFSGNGTTLLETKSKQLYRFSPRGFANPEFRVLKTEPATFEFRQGIVVVPVPNGKLVTIAGPLPPRTGVDGSGDDDDEVGAAIAGPKPPAKAGLPGYWIMVE